jgi:nucleoside-diphosphate-sugar epimerase
MASPEGLGLTELLKMIEAATGQKALLVNTESDDHHSPYGVQKDIVLDVKKVQALGYKPKSLMSWLPELIASHVGDAKDRNNRMH